MDDLGVEEPSAAAVEYIEQSPEEGIREAGWGNCWLRLSAWETWAVEIGKCCGRLA